MIPYSHPVHHLHPVSRTRTRLGPVAGALVPATLAFAAFAGLALGFLGWLFIHGTQPSITQVYRDGAFLLYEGEKKEGDVDSARLTGLTIVSAASTAVSVLAPLTSALYAYHVVWAWLAGPRNRSTPEQYAVLVGPLGTGSLPAVGRAGAYLARGKRRPRVPRPFVEAVAVALAAHVLAYAISGVDLWLHTVAATIIQTVDTPAAALSTDLLTGMRQCLRLFSGSVPSDDIPLDVLSNHSSDFRANTLADAGNLAVIVNPMVDVDKFTATTVGVRASCAMPQCTLPKPPANVTRTGFPPQVFPLFNLTEQSFPNDTMVSGSTMFMLSSDCKGCDHLDPDTYSNNLWEMLLGFDCGANCADQNAAARGQALAAQLKPPETRYSLWMQMVWEVTPKRVADASLSAPHDQGTYVGNGYYNTLLTDCTLNFYNVTLSYRNGNYTVVNETLSNPGLADGLAAPTRTGVINQQLMADIQGMVLAEGARPQDMQAYLEQDLAHLAIGAATVVTYTQPLTTDNAVVSTRLAGRYPFWPCVLFIVLLLLNGVFPLALGIAATLTRTERIAVSMKEGSGRSSMAVLELTKVRLTELTAVAAKLFHAPEGVLVGLHEWADGQVSFGLWRRHDGAGENQDMEA